MRKPTAATLKRLEQLEKQSKINRPHMLIPAPMSVEDWEAMVVPAQAELKRHVKSMEGGHPDYSKIAEVEMVKVY